jgi:SAM-dependent methyltransferase
MKRNRSHRANDFLIRDGEFVRDFEAMYQNVDDPWDQQERAASDPLSTAALWFMSEIVRRDRLRIDSILDLGCATGYYAERLLALSGDAGAHYVGVDISPTAIARAEQRLAAAPPHVTMRARFETGDIKDWQEKFAGKFDLIFGGKVLYYVGPEIDVCLDHIEGYLVGDGHLCYTYNQRDDSFSNKYVTYLDVRDRLLERGFEEKLLAEMNRLADEVLVVQVWQKRRGA